MFRDGVLFVRVRQVVEFIVVHVATPVFAQFRLRADCVRVVFAVEEFCGAVCHGTLVTVATEVVVAVARIGNRVAVVDRERKVGEHPEGILEAEPAVSAHGMFATAVCHMVRMLQEHAAFVVGAAHNAFSKPIANAATVGDHLDDAGEQRRVVHIPV